MAQSLGIFQSDITKRQVKRVRRLIDVLRSGSYKKQVGALRCNFYDKNEKLVSSQFCIMGVACDTMPGGKKLWASKDRDHHLSFEDEGRRKRVQDLFDGAEGQAPYEVEEYYGISDQSILINLNDTGTASGSTTKNGKKVKPMGFKGIARVVERELNTLVAAK